MRKSLPVMNPRLGHEQRAGTPDEVGAVGALLLSAVGSISARGDGNHRVGLLPVEDGFSAPLGGGLRVQDPVGVGDAVGVDGGAGAMAPPMLMLVAWTPSAFSSSCMSETAARSP